MDASGKTLDADLYKEYRKRPSYAISSFKTSACGWIFLPASSNMFY
jgi:hypothetical protein